MGWKRTMRLQSVSLTNPNPGKKGPSTPALPMWIDKDGRCFPEMQHFSEMLKKNNVTQKNVICVYTTQQKLVEIRFLQFDWGVNVIACNSQGSLDKRELNS